MTKGKNRPRPWTEFVGATPALWKIPFLRLEWVSEHACYWCSRRAFVELLGYVGKLSLLGALLVYLWPGIPQRRQAAEDARKSRHYVAWQTLNSAIGKPGNAGRADALEDLNKDGLSLADIDLSGGASFSAPLNLARADLQRANLTGTYFNHANLSGAKLQSSRIEAARIYYSDFSRADMSAVILKKVEFYGCDFSSATITPVECEDVQFVYCNFHQAHVAVAGEHIGFNERMSFSHQRSFKNTAFWWCNFANSDFNAPPSSFTPDTFKGCNLYEMNNGRDLMPAFIRDPRKNARIPAERFSVWLEWLNSHRPELECYDASYDVFYPADILRVKRQWPGRL
jgi:uncharacterized protein YjbI with pentapeptide repeats